MTALHDCITYAREKGGRELAKLSFEQAKLEEPNKYAPKSFTENEPHFDISPFSLGIIFEREVWKVFLFPF